MGKFVKFAVFLCILLSSQLSVAPAFERRELGRPDAKLVMYDFTSLACVHCATLHNNAFPDIKKNYIDKGLLKVIFMDVPFGSRENLFAHSLLYQTKNSEDFFMLATAILQEQKKWMQNENPQKVLAAYARLMGISEDKIKDAEKNTALHQWLLEESKHYLETLDIQGTPTLIIVKNGEKIESYKVKLSGVTNYSKISSELDKLLK